MALAMTLAPEKTRVPVVERMRLVVGSKQKWWQVLLETMEIAPVVRTELQVVAMAALVVALGACVCGRSA